MARFLAFLNWTRFCKLTSISLLESASKIYWKMFFFPFFIWFYIFSGLNEFLQSLGQEYSIYTYEMLNKGIDRDTLLSINDEQLLLECGIDNKIHRFETIYFLSIASSESCTSAHEIHVSKDSICLFVCLLFGCYNFQLLRTDFKSRS